MKVKLRLIGGKVDSSALLLNLENGQLGSKILVTEYPVTQDVGVVTFLEEFKLEENEFQICVKSLDNKVLGKGSVFRSKIMLSEEEGVILYNINKAYFENRESGYIIELFNKNKQIDRFILQSDTNIYNMYNNLEEKGVIEF